MTHCAVLKSEDFSQSILTLFPPVIASSPCFCDFPGYRSVFIFWYCRFRVLFKMFEALFSIFQRLKFLSYRMSLGFPYYKKIDFFRGCGPTNLQISPSRTKKKTSFLITRVLLLRTFSKSVFSVHFSFWNNSHVSNFYEPPQGPFYSLSSSFAGQNFHKVVEALLNVKIRHFSIIYSQVPIQANPVCCHGQETIQHVPQRTATGSWHAYV